MPDSLATRPLPKGARWSALLARMLVFLGLWFVFTRADATAVAYGLGFAALATWVSWRWLPVQAPLIAWFRLPVLLPKFVLQVLRGGVDVAVRAWSTRMPLKPGFMRVELKVRRGRYVLSYLIMLMPGTLVVDYTARGLVLHVIDRGQPVRETVAWLQSLFERREARQ